MTSRRKIFTFNTVVNAIKFLLLIIAAFLFPIAMREMLPGISHLLLILLQVLFNMLLLLFWWKTR